jgi:hypothetical protein
LRLAPEGRIIRRMAGRYTLTLAVVLLVGALPAAPRAVAETGRVLTGFHSPSGNIRCLYIPPSRDDTGHPLPASLLCSIRKANYAARLQTGCMNPNGETGAGVDWHRWRLAPTRQASVLCSGGILYNPDTDQPRYQTLAYGRSWQRGVFTCASATVGVTCRTTQGHGLFISRQSWRAW